MGLPETDCAPSGLEIPSIADEIEMGGGAICTVIGGTLSSEIGAAEACCDTAASGNAIEPNISVAKANETEPARLE
jgi:hypothetical protein